jgi:8-oxo-dGTP diphosphatase
MDEKIKIVDLEKDDLSKFNENSKFTGCLVVTADNKILLQQRPDNWWTHPGCLSTFGGKIEEGERVLSQRSK